jgi:cullin-associated NEDD8-dissociated protein 1
LGSLREIIVQQSASVDSIQKLAGFFNQLSEILFQHTASEEEGNRNVISECLGKLALINPEVVFNALLERVGSDKQETRACIVTAIKFAIHEKAVSVDPVLQEKIQPFLELLKDNSILVRKAALLSLNYIAYQKPKIIKTYLHQYLPCLYGETRIKKELIHEVTIGPFTHKVDDGLELRKAAFECMYTLLDTCLDSLDLPEFIAQLKEGLEDHEDIKMLNHMILTRLAQKSGTALVANLTDLVDPLRKTVTAKTKEEAVKQQVERNEEMIQSALRAIHQVAQISEIESCPKFLEFYNNVILQGPISEKYNSLRQSKM